MKKFFSFVIIVGAGYYFWQNPPDWGHKPTTKSHHGTAQLFMEAALNGTAGGMQAYCKGSAVERCALVLDQIRQANPTFARYQIEMGGVLAGNKATGRVMLFGSQKDMFMTLAIDLEKEGEDWKVYELNAAEND